MCNLYRMTRGADEVARLFAAVSIASNAGEEVYPGYPGVVFDGAALRTMTWGFPLALKSKKTGAPLKPRPVNNTRSDKLDSFMWRYSFAERRCLIPLTAFAEAEGEPGRKTRTWFTMPDQPIFTAAGIWRDSDEWGPVYSMVMTDESAAMAGIHDRSPVLLDPDQRDTWLSGPLEDARALCRPYEGTLAIDRTADTWGGR